MRTTPFFKLLLPLVTGILLGKFLFHHNWLVLISFLFMSFLLLLIFKSNSNSSRRSAMIKSAFLFSHFLCWGLFIVKYYEFEENKELNERSQHVLTLSSVWKKSKNHFKASASTQGQNLFAKGDVLIMIRSDSIPKGLPGDILITKQKFKPINPPLNPFQFDYKSYLQNQGVGFSLYLREKEFIIIQQDQQILLIRFFSQLRIDLLKLLDSFPLTQASRAFIKALLLGDKSELDAEVSSAFSSAGAMHVLAVSGLHVGIIVSIFSFFLSLFKVSPGNRGFRWFKTIFLLLIIWVFAGITGFSPSIVRASIMFSFISIGQSIIRHTNVYNSLSMAAFFMLLIDPNNLFSVGFQLSFLAVGGIVFFYDKIYKSLFFSNRVIRQIWSISSVSIAAQLATFPLALFYFHQFPVYFMLSNLIVIPAAFVVLLLSVFLFFLSIFKWPVLILSIILNKTIALLNFLIIGIKRLPFTTISDVYIDERALLLILLSILIFSIYIINKKAVTLIIGLFFSILIFGYRIFHKIEEYTQHQLIIYSISRHHAFDLIQNNEHVIFTDSLLWKNQSKLKYASENFLRMKGLKPINKSKKEVIGQPNTVVKNTYLLSENHFIFGNSILCLNHSSHISPVINKMKHRLVLTTNSSDRNPLNPELYEFVILNNAYLKEDKGFNAYKETYQTSTIIHPLLSDGFFSFTPSK